MATAAAVRADCATPTQEWELELVELTLEGEGDLAAEQAALGTRATLQGDFVDLANERPAQVTLLVGDDADGASLTFVQEAP
jgi:hypothetical protein